MKHKQYTSAFRFVCQLLAPYKGWYIFVLWAPIAHAIHPLLYNYVIKLVVDGIADKSVLEFSFSNPILCFAYLEFFKEISWRLHNLASWRFMPYMYKTALERVFGYVINHSYRFFQDNLSGSITSKVKGVEDGVYKILRSIESDGISIFISIFSGVALLTINFKIFLIVGIFVAITIPLTYISNRQLYDVEEDAQQDWHKILGMVADNITNVFNLFAFATKSREVKNLMTYYEINHIPKRLKWWRLCFWWNLGLASIGIGLMFVLAFYLIHLSKIGEVSLGSIIFIIAMIQTFLDNLWRAFNGIKDFIQRYAQMQAAFSIMQIPHESFDPTDAKDIVVRDGSIEFKGLSFSYGENLVLQNLDLKIKSGEKVGIVGSSGVGKSTLANLLMKNFVPNKGEIIIDGQRISEVTSDSLRQAIIYIPQEVILFHRTIAENIGYAKENPTQKEIIDAAEKATLSTFIDSLPNKYATIVGERGIKLSGGQRQRVAIARAFLKNAPILILDEATSALDSITEREIQNSLWKLMQGKTCIVIAHRLSTLVDMDRILVFDQGRILQDGSHKELIAKNGIYKNLWETQVNGCDV